MDKHDTLLISCGSAENRQQLRSALGCRYNLLESGTFQQMLTLLKQNHNCIAAVVIDITQPDILDRTVLKRDGLMEQLGQIPVIILSEDDSVDTLNMLFDDGAADVIPLNYDSYAMLRRIENIVDLHLHKQHLETMVEEQAQLLRHSNETMVDALSSIIEYRSVESGQHILRIRHFTKLLLEEVARSCPEYRLTDRLISIISSASALHDIGKIAISDSILMKPGPLTKEEREIMKTHTVTGCQILDSLQDMGDPEYRRYAHNICHYHHERWDGGGYPEGLKGEEIPICAQVVGLADVYDALTTKRVYKEAFSFDRAVNMILRGDCGVFSPKLLECFKHITNSFESLARAYADGLSPNTETFDMTLPSPEAEKADSMERVRAKYYALVHYINGILLEVDLNRGLFHLIYNPYPELSWFQEITTFDEMSSLLDDRVESLDERGDLQYFLRVEMVKFVEADMRRMTRYFRFKSAIYPEGETFEVTFLRINPIDAARRTLAILCRRVEENRISTVEQKVQPMTDSTFVCRNDDGFTLIRLGRHIPRLGGYTPEMLEAEHQGQLLKMVHPEDREKMRREFREHLQKGTSGEAEYRVCQKDGSVIWVHNRFRLTIGAGGEEYLNCVLTDITRSKRELDELTEKLRRYEIILAQTENVLFEWDIKKNAISFSDTWQSIFGFSLNGNDIRSSLADGSYFHPDDFPLLLDRIVSLEHGSPYEMIEVRVATTMGRYIWCRFRASAIRDETGRLEKVAGIIINIDAEKQAQRLLQERAERDSLTKLLNKNAARRQAEEYLNRFPTGTNCALLIIDLDNFKEVNDRFGHLFGDAVLTKVARDIEKLFRSQDIVARIGGDEFLVLMRSISDRGLLESRCQRLIASIRERFRNHQGGLSLGCSIGIALSPDHGTSYYDLFSRADQALYRAKENGKNTYAFYDGSAAGYRSRGTGRIDSDEEPGLAEDNIVRYAFQKLYAARDVEASINEILALIGKKMNVSRVYVFENSDDNRFCYNTYEWCNEGIPAEIGNLQGISYETDIPGYEEYFDENGIFYCPDVATLSKGAYEILEPQGIKSMLQCAIRENGVFRGYIGFDECVEYRLWTKEQIGLLTFFSESLSMFLLRMRRQEKVQQQADELTSILDNQDAWIYIVDPDSHALKYINGKMKRQIPGICPGQTCYQAIRGRTLPCDNCPAKTARKQGFCSRLQKGQHGHALLAEGTQIQWEGREAALVSFRELPEQE